MAQPLLIGGATTSRVHTAVKLAPRAPSVDVVHVDDASRAVPVVAQLVSEAQRGRFLAEVKADQEKVRAQYARDREATPFCKPGKAVDPECEYIARQKMRATGVRCAADHLQQNNFAGPEPVPIGHPRHASSFRSPSRGKKESQVCHCSKLHQRGDAKASCR